MQKENYKFFNLPVECGILDYKKAASIVIEKYSKIRNLTSIYNWGDPSVPGISDMDLLLVFSNNAEKPMPIFKRSYYFLNSKTKYLMSHPFIFIDKESLQSVRYVYRNTSFKLLYGKNIRIKNLTPAENKYADTTLLNDIIVRHYPRDFLEQVVTKKINVRNTLLRLNSLKYSTGILESLTNEKCGWNEKLKLIDSLRKNWFEKKDFNLLASLNKDAAAITLEITERFKALLIKDGIVKIMSGNQIIYNGIKNRSLFSKEWNRDDALKKMSDLIKSGKKFYSILPLELSAQICEYAKNNGLISSYIRSNMAGSIDYELKDSDVIGERIRILNKQAELASRLKHSDFAAFFDFGFRNKSGINNRIIGMLDKARF